MKNFLKATVLTAVVALCCVVALLAVGCSSDKTYTGEYSYTQYGTNYGVKVEVKVSDDNVITGVRIVSSDYVSVSPAGGNWTAEDVNNWNSNVGTLLKAYNGKKVADVLAMQVATSAEGAPLAKDADGFKQYDSSLIISGATLGSGRVLLAVQNALKDLK